MVEKEEKSRDVVEFLAPTEKPATNIVTLRNNQVNLLNEPYLGSETFNSPYFAQVSTHRLFAWRGSLPTSDWII